MMNKIFLQGRLCADPEMRETAGGISRANFLLAVDRDYTGADGQRHTDFINCVCWRGTAEFVCKYFFKGSPLLLVGQLTTRNYEDKQGNKRVAYEVNADHCYFCGGKKEAGGSREADAPPMPQGNPAGKIYQDFRRAEARASFADKPAEQVQLDVPYDDLPW